MYKTLKKAKFYDTKNNDTLKCPIRPLKRIFGSYIAQGVPARYAADRGLNGGFRKMGDFYGLKQAEFAKIYRIYNTDVPAQYTE